MLPQRDRWTDRQRERERVRDGWTEGDREIGKYMAREGERGKQQDTTVNISNYTYRVQVYLLTIKAGCLQK